MSIEIHQPDLEHRVQEAIRSGRYHDVNEMLRKALDLPESSGRRIGSLDWSQCPAVESVAGRLNGTWVFRHTRLPVSTVFENLEDGATIDQISEWFDIGKEQVIEVLAFAAQSVAAPVSVPTTPAHDAHPV